MKPRTAAEITHSWTHEARWKGIERRYTAQDVLRMRGTVQVEHTLARMGAERLWHPLPSHDSRLTF